jgi:hypothetical protein
VAAARAICKVPPVMEWYTISNVIIKGNYCRNSRA